MTNQSIAYLNISQTLELIKSRQVSSTELTKACLERIEMLDPQLNCFITLTSEKALNQAQAIDRMLAKKIDPGGLASIPFAIKDLFNTCNIPTTPITAPYIEGPNAVEQAPVLTRFTSPFNLTGLPALSLPCGFNHKR